MFKMTPDVVSAVLASDDASSKIAMRLGVSAWMVQKIRRTNGVARKVGAPTIFADALYANLKAAADEAGLVHKSQTAMAAEFGRASSHVNRAIKLLMRDGRLKCVRKHNYGTWTYEVISPT
jgi:hypothetical protein